MEKKLNNKFPKSERVYSRKEIEYLFAKGDKEWSFPFAAHYIFEDRKTPQIKIGISVPKRKIKKAVDRNRAKRVIKEAFRLQKQVLGDINSQPITIFIVYSHYELPDLDDIKAKIVRIFEKIKTTQEKK